MRRWLPILICLGLAAMAAVALARVGSASGARATAIATSGAFAISSSEEGEPIFAAAGIAPGGSARGTVTIEDTGSDPAALTLRSGELVDAPGLGGGLLSERLRLTVVDITAPAAPRTVYAGPLDSMPDQAAGTLKGGEARTFEFVATLPESGAPGFQNAVQGGSTTVSYAWIASEAKAAEASGGKGGEEEHGGGSPGGGGPDGDQSSGASTSPGGGEQSNIGFQGVGDALTLIVPKIRPVPRHGRLVAWTRCDQACRLTVRGHLRATSLSGHHRGAKIRFAKKRLYAAGAQRLRIPIPRGLRRWMRETPGRERLRAKLRFVAVGTDGQTDAVRKTVKLRQHHR